MPKSYFKLKAEEIYAMIHNKMPKGQPRVIEIGCGGISTQILGEMLEKKLIFSYEGYNIDKERIEETKKRGLVATLVGKDFSYINPFFALKNQCEDEGRLGVIAMFELPEVAPDAAKMYAKQAKKSGLEVISYPEI